MSGDSLYLDGRPGWMDRGACLGHPADWWFPARGASTKPAMEICATCPVLDECREYGMDQRWGIWGGVSERERRKIRRQRAAEANPGGRRGPAPNVALSRQIAEFVDKRTTNGSPDPIEDACGYFDLTSTNIYRHLRRHRLGVVDGVS